MKEHELLRRFAAAKLPYRLVTAEDFSGAQALQASGYIKLAMPPVRSAKGTYGKQDAALVLAITTAGRRALAP